MPNKKTIEKTKTIKKTTKKVNKKTDKKVVEKIKVKKNIAKKPDDKKMVDKIITKKDIASKEAMPSVSIEKNKTDDVDLTKMPETVKPVDLKFKRKTPLAIDSSMSKKELAEKRKKAKANIKKQIESEKKNLVVEYNKINEELARAKKNMQISVAKEKTAKVEAAKKLKMEKTQYLIDLKSIKEQEIEWSKTIQAKKKTLALKNKEHAEKTKISIQQLRINSINKRSELDTQKQQLRDEMKKFMAEQKMKIESKKAENVRILQELKIEQREQAAKLNESRSVFRNELTNRKLELQNEINAYKKSKEFELQEARENKIASIANARKKTNDLELERNAIKQELVIAKLSSRARIEEIKSQTKRTVTDIATSNKVVAMQGEAAVQEIIEKQKFERLEREKQKHEAGNEVSIIPYVETENNNVDVPSDNISNSEVIKETNSPKPSAKIEGVENKISKFLGKWKQIEKRGSKIYSKIQGLTTNKEVKSFNKNEYFSTMIKNYEAADKAHAFVELKSLIKQSFVLSVTKLKDVEIDRVYEVYVKAILTRLQVEFGNYFIIPKSIKGRASFIAVKTISPGASVFSLKALIGDEVNNALKTIVDYKLNIGSSIKIFDGLAIEAVDGNLQIIIMPNALRR